MNVHFTDRFFITIRYLLLVTAIVGLTIVSGCGGNNSPMGSAGEVPVMFSFTTSDGALGKTSATQTSVLSDALGNSLEIESAALVIRKFEMKPARFGQKCDTIQYEIEELEHGPFVVELPVEATTPQIMIEASLPEGLWKELEFKIHSLSRNDMDDAQIIASYNFADSSSVRVTGQWTPAGGAAEPFVFLANISEKLEFELEPPLEVAADSTHNITIAVELDGWFRNGNETLIDPRTALRGQPNAWKVRRNIIESIDAYEDRNHDGCRDWDDFRYKNRHHKRHGDHDDDD